MPACSISCLRINASAIYTPAEGQEALPFYGTGVSFTHGNEILILFGDVTLDEFGTPLTASHDDCQGAISLEDFPDGDAVDMFLRWCWLDGTPMSLSLSLSLSVHDELTVERSFG